MTLLICSPALSFLHLSHPPHTSISPAPICTGSVTPLLKEVCQLNPVLTYLESYICPNLMTYYLFRQSFSFKYFLTALVVSLIPQSPQPQSAQAASTPYWKKSAPWIQSLICRKKRERELSRRSSCLTRWTLFLAGLKYPLALGKYDPLPGIFGK